MLPEQKQKADLLRSAAEDTLKAADTKARSSFDFTTTSPGIKTASDTLPSPTKLPSLPATRLYARDEASWKQTKDRAARYYSLPSTGEQMGELFPLSQLDAKFAYVAQPGDEFFRTQHVESLLDQSADLLDRGLSQRAEWNDLFVKSFNVASEIREFFELDRIHNDETDSGFYTHDSIEARNIYAAEANNSSNLQAHAQILSGIRDTFYSPTVVTSLSDSSQLLAWLSHLANYDREAQGSFMSYSWDGVSKTSHDHAQAAATNLSYNNLNLQQNLLTSQSFASNVAALTAQGRAASYLAKASWESANSGFRQRRTEVSRRIADAKVASYTKPGGALNYPERMTRIEARFRRDFRDALARISAAREGLKKLYGYDEPLPASVMAALSNKPQDQPGAFDEALIWVRNAIAYLVKFGQIDQRYSFPVSVRELIGEDLYKAARKVVPWATFSFTISEQLFPAQYYVRLRGLSIYIVTASDIPEPAGVWLGQIKAPAKSYCLHLPKGNAAPVREELDQSKIPPSMAGRISYREARRPADVVAASTFHNLSPFGQWNLQLSSRSTQDVKTANVHDIVVEFHIAMRMAAT